jgi:hypothetical protein
MIRCDHGGRDRDDDRDGGMRVCVLDCVCGSMRQDWYSMK